jgi:hypothetical protein
LAKHRWRADRLPEWCVFLPLAHSFLFVFLLLLLLLLAQPFHITLICTDKEDKAIRSTETKDKVMHASEDYYLMLRPGKSALVSALKDKFILLMLPAAVNPAGSLSVLFVFLCRSYFEIHFFVKFVCFMI